MADLPNSAFSVDLRNSVSSFSGRLPPCILGSNFMGCVELLHCVSMTVSFNFRHEATLERVSVRD